jgi:hypothetical protein
MFRKGWILYNKTISPNLSTHYSVSLLMNSKTYLNWSLHTRLELIRYLTAYILPTYNVYILKFVLWKFGQNCIEMSKVIKYITMKWYLLKPTTNITNIFSLVPILSKYFSLFSSCDKTKIFIWNTIAAHWPLQSQWLPTVVANKILFAGQKTFQLGLKFHFDQHLFCSIKY